MHNTNFVLLNFGDNHTDLMFSKIKEINPKANIISLVVDLKSIDLQQAESIASKYNMPHAVIDATDILEHTIFNDRVLKFESSIKALQYSALNSFEYLCLPFPKEQENIKILEYMNFISKISRPHTLPTATMVTMPLKNI